MVQQAQRPVARLSQKEAAALAGVTPRTVRRWTASGLLPTSRRGKQALSYMPTDVAMVAARPVKERTCPLCRLAPEPLTADPVASNQLHIERTEDELTP